MRRRFRTYWNDTGEFQRLCTPTPWQTFDRLRMLGFIFPCSASRLDWNTSDRAPSRLPAPWFPFAICSSHPYFALCFAGPRPSHRFLRFASAYPFSFHYHCFTYHLESTRALTL